MPELESQSPNPSPIADLPQILLESIREIVSGLDLKVTTMNQQLQQTDAAQEAVQQNVAVLSQKIGQFSEAFQQIKTTLKNIDSRSGSYDKRFEFIADRLTTLAEQSDHLDIEFGSLKTLILAAVDKAMKEYSNFVVEKLTLGNTIDVLRLEVDKMKKRIEKLEQK